MRFRNKCMGYPQAHSCKVRYTALMNPVNYMNVLHDLLNIVVHENASDIHLSVGAHPMVRMNGVLLPIEKHPVLTEQDLQGFLRTMAQAPQEQRFAETNELDIAYSMPDGSRFRVNAFVAQGAIGIIMRYIPNIIKTFDELGLPPVLETFTQRKQGLFLVVGPVGQGKTSTLAAMIERINETRNAHIMTIEDPVEFLYTPKKAHINQREVRVDTSDFGAGLNAALRQDINVLLVGEMRGLEAISTTITAAETGHLVFATLHTNSAAQTIDRIIDSFPAGQQDQIRLQLSTSLIGVLSQRLLPKISGGRVPVCELLVNTTAVANLIRERRTHEIRTAIETGSEYGMIDMNRALVNLVHHGDITAETAYANSPDPRVLERLF